MKISKWHFSIFLLLIPLCLSCSLLFSEQKTFCFEFSKGTRAWSGSFAEYNVGGEAFFELGWGWFNLPASLVVNGQTLSKGMLLTGNNHSDDLFMYIKRKVQGLKPNTEYELSFLVTIEDNIPPGGSGVGGAPGESVYFKVGASRKKPAKVTVGSLYRINLDIGFQSQGGKNAIVVGNLANPLVDPNNPTYQPKTFANTTPLKMRTDSKGQLWLFVGTDSGFEGPTHYYIASIKVVAKST